MRMVVAAVALGLVWQAERPRVQPEARHFQFQRQIKVMAGANDPVCAVLDAPVFAHSPELTDIRLYGADGAEIPYAELTTQAAAGTDPARVLNVGMRGGRVVFDLEMPARAYSEVDLRLAGENFLATATVTGLSSRNEAVTAGTQAGTFTLFDLSVQRLGRSTTLALAESSFPYLHVELEAKAAPDAGRSRAGFKSGPEMVEGAEVPASRAAQTIYTVVAQSSAIRQKNRESVAEFQVPAHVPVERVEFVLEPGYKTNFSRAVQITAEAARGAGPDGPVPVERVDGEISRVDLMVGGKQIREESRGVTAVLGSNARDDARVLVAVENGDDKPLGLAAVRLEMRERRLCFDAPADLRANGGAVTMRYGDPEISAPVYDYARLFRTTDADATAQLGAEEKNPEYVARKQKRSLVDEHPALVWAGLLAALAVLGWVAVRSAKRV